MDESRYQLRSTLECILFVWSNSNFFNHLFFSPFQVERLSEYEQYFASLLVDTHPDHPDRHHLATHHDRLTQVSTGLTSVKIEHLFPSFDVTSDRIDLLSLRCGVGEVITREIFPSASVY